MAGQFVIGVQLHLQAIRSIEGTPSTVTLGSYVTVQDRSSFANGRVSVSRVPE
jgi:hypothetical protein